MKTLRTIAVVLSLLAAAAAQESFCAAEHGELAPDSSDANPIIRFGVVAMNEPSWMTYDDKGKGFLYFSRERMWYESSGSKSLDVSRSDIQGTKEWESMMTPMGWAQVNTGSSGKWYFKQISCSGSDGGFQEILDAIGNFGGVSARVVAAAPKKLPPPPPAPPPPPPTGSIKIKTVPPGAQVYLDDRFKGTTSEQEGVLVVDDLKAGNYKLRVSNSGFKDWTESESLSAGETLELTATLVTAGPKPLSLSDVEDLLRNNVPRARVQKLLDTYGVDFGLSSENESRLRTVGADDSLLLAIAKAKK